MILTLLACSCSDPREDHVFLDEAVYENDDWERPGWELLDELPTNEDGLHVVMETETWTMVADPTRRTPVVAAPALDFRGRRASGGD